MNAPAGLPRLLTEIPDEGAMELARHLEVHGPVEVRTTRPASPVGQRSGRRGREHPLIEELEHAGLCGRGGGAFPTAVKLRAVGASRGRPVVVVNAAEGEPASRKDRVLTRALPHLVLDGAALAADALGADEVIVCICQSARESSKSVAAALSERRSATRARNSPLGRRTSFQLRALPGHYVAGHESAVVQRLNGGPALPTFTPPMPFQRGVGGRPTLVSNAETLAHVALIARHGSDWFRELGTRSQPGSALVTLSGPVAHPGVYEIEYGVPLSSLIQAAGGVSAPLGAALLGGYGGSWIGKAPLGSLHLSDAELAPFRASLGAGVVALLHADSCPIAETARLLRWLAGQSAGQCGPCVHGLGALAATFEQIVSSRRDSAQRGEADRRIEYLAGLIEGRGACAHPDGATRLALSALDQFGAELDDHLRNGPCERCSVPGQLALPRARARSSPAGRRRRAPTPVPKSPTRS